MSTRKASLEISARQFLVGVFDRAAVNADERTIELSYSSETPVQRWWGIEVLGHSAGEVDESWIGSGRAPLLVDHVARVDQQVGVVTRSWIASGKGRALVRFGKGDRASEIFQRVVDGELCNVSVGYEIERAVLVSEENDVGTYRMTRWKPYEISLVSVPADSSVGVGRSQEEQTKTIPLDGAESMNIRSDAGGAAAAVPAAAAVAAAAAAAPVVDVAAVLAAERRRMAEIEAVGAQFNCRDKATKAIADGISVESFRGLVLDHIGAERAQPILTAAASVGMSEKEKRQFSFLRALNCLANPNVAAFRNAAAFELEVSEAAVKRYGKESRGIMVPVDVLVHGQRDLSVGTATAGGHTVATDLVASSFIDLLRKKMMIRELGATVLADLNGNIAIPRQTGGATAFWQAEAGSPTESQQAFDQVTMTPRNVGAFTDYSRKLLLQSSIDVENFVRTDLAKVIALEIDRAAIHGSGASNQPIGIVATSGIGSVAGGANGAIPTWANIVDLETQVANANADIGSLAYLTNAKVRGKLKTVEKAASSAAQFIWEKGAGNGFGELNGYRAAATNQVSSALTKGASAGICSAILFGNFADLLIGFWSGLDLLVDPYTGGTAGTVRVVAMQDTDVAVRHPESFSAMLDALTT